ncbi:MAG: LytTR family DNA-binding domain-containing protein, partial [Chitinophagales bacterium]
MIRSIIIDDDEVSRQVLKSFIERTSGILLSGEFNSAIDALPIIDDNNIDLIFLDIEMPEMTGFQFLEHCKDNLNEVVLTTSKSEYAAQAFEYDIADYLIKPIDYSRFLLSIKKVNVLLDNNRDKCKLTNALFVKKEGIYMKVLFDKIKWIEASGDYVSIVCDDKTHMIHSTMKLIEQHLPLSKFVRVHRSYIVNINKLDNFDKEFCVVNGKMIPIGKSYRNELIGRLNVV